MSHLFLVRLWLEESGGQEPGTIEGGETAGEALSWYGRVQHVISGQTGSFDSAASMLQLLADLLPASIPANEEQSEDAGIRTSSIRSSASTAETAETAEKTGLTSEKQTRGSL